MKLFLEKGTLRSELARTLAHFEKQAAGLGMHPDELVEQFHHNNVAIAVDDTKQVMHVFNSRKRYLAEREYADKPSVLSVIR